MGDRRLESGIATELEVASLKHIATLRTRSLEVDRYQTESVEGGSPN